MIKSERLIHVRYKILKEFCQDLKELRIAMKRIKYDTGQNAESASEAEDEPMSDCEEKVERPNLNQLVQQTPIIFKKILDLLTGEDLKNFRLASSTWNKIISTHMLKEDTISLTFQFDQDRQEYLQLQSMGYKTMKDFMDCLLNSENFPCNNFILIDGGDFSDREAEWIIILKQLFTQIGRQIKRLTLGTSHPSLSLDMDMDTLRLILLDLAPNIEELSLTYCRNLEWKNSSRLVLPALKSLTCLAHPHDRRSTACDMLIGAPQLESVYNFKINYIFVFVSYLNAQIIKQLDDIYYIPGDISVGKKLLRFAEAQPKLNSICLPPDWSDSGLLRSDFVKSMNEILESSKESLQVVRAVTMATDGLVIPQLKNVKILEFLKSPWIYKLFPKGINLSEVFPNVESLTWNFHWTDRMINWNILIPPGHVRGRLDSVRILKVSASRIKEWIGQVTRLLPQVTDLTVELEEANVEDLTLIHSHYPNLEKLCLQDYHGYLLPLISDASLTGIPQKKVNVLTCYMSKESRKMTELQTRSGICDFKRLKSFRIVLDNQNWSEEIVSNLVMMSWVTSVYAFSRPGLQVSIEYDQDCPSAEQIGAALASVIVS